MTSVPLLSEYPCSAFTHIFLISVNFSVIKNPTQTHLVTILLLIFIVFNFCRSKVPTGGQLERRGLIQADRQAFIVEDGISCMLCNSSWRFYYNNGWVGINFK
jgi:hypothetical protein